MKPETTPFVLAEHLDSEEIIRALGHIARARGITELSAKTGLGRESLYKTFAAGSKPRFDTILKVIRALELPISFRQTAG